jgi:hypothetical protein
MSVWPRTSAAATSLSGREGDLISVSISVDPRYLESLLETLAQVSFPLNPQIYHDAAIVFLHPDGREETEATTLVEFPAYASQLEEVRTALESHGFDPASLQVTGMLEEIQGESPLETPPPGVQNLARHRVKHRVAGAH